MSLMMMMNKRLRIPHSRYLRSPGEREKSKTNNGQMNIVKENVNKSVSKYVNGSLFTGKEWREE